jgi:hypothetical protein
LRAIGRWAAANERWLSIVVATVSALLFSIYTGIATTVPAGEGGGAPGLVDRLAGLGSLNLLALAGLLALVAQVFLAASGRRSRRLRQREEGQQLTEALLEGVLDLVSAYQPRETIYRGLVAIADKEAGVRTAVLGAHMRADPELNLSKPIYFGVAGEAYRAKSVRAADLDDSNRDIAQDGTRVPGIWKETRCVLAYPLIGSDHEAYGTLNLDSNESLADSRLGDRKVQEAIGKISDVVNYLMRHHSESGEAPLPR